jgi:hypothetical protein
MEGSVMAPACREKGKARKHGDERPGFGKGNGKYPQCGQEKENSYLEKKGRKEEVERTLLELDGKKSQKQPQNNKNKGCHHGNPGNIGERYNKKDGSQKHERKADNKKELRCGTAGNYMMHIISISAKSFLANEVSLC